MLAESGQAADQGRCSGKKSRSGSYNGGISFNVGNCTAPRESPRSMTKAKTVTWLKSKLEELGCAGDKLAHPIDDCFQSPLPSFHKFNSALVSHNQGSTILNSLAFSNILKNVCALRTEYVMKIARPILQKLMSHSKNMNVFNQPVDPEALGIPTYFQVIKEPMDLGTVLARLRAGHYHSVGECFRETELVFANAMQFNPAAHPVHKMAQDLREDFHVEVKLAEDKCVKDVSETTECFEITTTAHEQYTWRMAFLSSAFYSIVNAFLAMLCCIFL